MAAGFAIVIAAGFALFRASRIVHDAASLTSTDIPFTAARLDRVSTPFEPIAAPAVFRDAVPFHGSLYICGPAGLIEFDSEGNARTRFAAGADLPAPLVAAATGIAADSIEPELFLATAGEGLLAFNGTTFRQVRPARPEARNFTAVLPLSNGRILLGTAKAGVLVYDGRRLAPFHASLTALQVSALAGDDANLWIGTLNDGVLHWHAGELQRFNEPQGLPDPHALAVTVSRDAAYAATPLGVAEFVSGRFTRVLAEGVFAQSLLVRNGALAIGTLDEGVFEVPLAPGRPRPATRTGAAIPGKVERLLEMEGRLYALSAEGLYRINESRGGWDRMLDRGATVLTDRNISALAFDSAGRLWTGYFDRGLDIVDAHLQRATHIENDHVFCVNRIVSDPARGITAAATANGLVLFDAAGRERQVLRRPQGLIADQVTDVLLQNDGMTVATPAGLTLFDAHGARSLYAFHGLVNNHAYSLAAAGRRLLVGTLGGLSVLEGDAVRASYTTSNSGLRHNWITAIVEAGPESFVGTYGAGVLRFDANGRWQTFPDLRTPFEVNNNAMLATDAAVYAGSLRDGLYIYDRASGRWHNVKSGLPSPNVTALAARGGYIYAGTDNGLVRFPENSR